MQKNDLIINISTIRMKNIKFPNSELTQNKSTNTVCNLINSNQRFKNNESETGIINTKKSINSYFYISPRSKIFEFKKNNFLKNKYKKEIKIQYRNNDNILPILPKNQSVRQIKEKDNIFLNKIKPKKIKIIKKRELVINPVSLNLFSLKEKNNRKPYSNKNKGNKIRDEFLQRVKEYRNMLKEQMINRNKFQYSHSNNSLNTSLNQKKEKEPKKEKEINETKFNYNQSNNYIFNMNENVDKALNKFYYRLRNARKALYDMGKQNHQSVKSSLYITNNETKSNDFNTISIK